MAGVEFKGLDDLRRQFANISKVVSEEALEAGEDAAAKVFRDAAKNAAPRNSGQLASSIRIIVKKARDKLSSLQGAAFRKVYVGPEKKKGYYGFFVEKGYTWSKGRRSRRATATTHSQRGPTAGSKRIPARPWFKPAMDAVMGTAEQSFKKAFNEKLQQIANRFH